MRSKFFAPVSLLIVYGEKMYSTTAAHTSAMAGQYRDKGIEIEGFLGHRQS